MNIISDFFNGSTILEVAESPVNGKITVVKSLGLGTYLQVGNLTQSGGVVSDIWKTTLKKIKREIAEPQNILILGFGGGSCAKTVRKLWPYAILTGVDFDRTIVELGKKYLKFDDTNADIVISDAYDFTEKQRSLKHVYDLIIIDLYVGQEFPVVFESDEFLNNIKNILTDRGTSVFNRLYFGEKRFQAVKFADNLEKYFSKVEYFYPEANLMLICTK